MLLGRSVSNTLGTFVEPFPGENTGFATGGVKGFCAMLGVNTGTDTGIGVCTLVGALTGVLLGPVTGD